MSSDWSDTMVWFGQILLYLHFYHPVYIILDFVTFSQDLCGVFDNYSQFPVSTDDESCFVEEM